MREARLIGIGNSSIGNKANVSLDSPCFIGRTHENNQIVCRDKAVSDKHAVVRYEDDGFYVEDLGSITGTYVNDTKIGEEVMNIKNLVKENSDKLKTLNKGKIQIQESGIIHLGKDLQTEYNNHIFDYKFYFTENLSLDTYPIDLHLGADISLGLAYKMAIDGKVYLLQDVRKGNNSCPDARIICMNPILELFLVDESGGDKFYFLGESIDSLLRDQKDELRERIEEVFEKDQKLYRSVQIF